MSTSGASPSPTPPPYAELDNEITTIRSQIQSLRQRRKTLATSFLTSTSGQSLLNRVPTIASRLSASTEESAPLLLTAKRLGPKLSRRAQESVYRLGAGCTTFKVRDPDPNAVNKGQVLGVRIDIFADSKFQTPYYLLLTKPYTEQPSLLHIHKHTIPPCIPLRYLSSKYLPEPVSTTAPIKSRRQDLPGLVKALRREIVSLHLREASLAAVRRDLNLKDTAAQPNDSEGVSKGRYGVQDVTFTDGEKLDIRIQWSSGAIGRLRLSKAGTIEKCVIFGPEGRDREAERLVIQENGVRVEELFARLKKVRVESTS